MLAEGCPKRYIELVNELFAANKLVCPDLVDVRRPKQECQIAPPQFGDSDQTTSITVDKVADSTPVTSFYSPEDEKDILQVININSPTHTCPMGGQDGPHVINNETDPLFYEYITCREFGSMLINEDRG